MKVRAHVLPALGARTVHRARLWSMQAPTTKLLSRTTGRSSSRRRAPCWGALPMFEAPLAGKVLTLGHELAILAYIERKCPAVAGADEREWAVSQQFVHQAEDVYPSLRSSPRSTKRTRSRRRRSPSGGRATTARSTTVSKRLQVHLALLEAARRRRPRRIYGRSGSHTARFPRRRPPQFDDYERFPGQLESPSASAS